MSLRSPPAFRSPPRLLPLPVRRHTLSNGLLIACVEQHHVPIVDVQVVIRAGAARDEPARAGRAAMVAEMLDEGTSSRSVLQIADEIDYLGAHLGLSAGWDSTVLSLHVSSSRLGPALEVMADVLLRPGFPPAEFERKKRERLTGLLQEDDEPRLLANKAMMRGIFGTAHPYGAPAGGTYQSIEVLQLEEVRHFYTQHYRPDNAFVVVVGAIQFDDIVQQLEDRFAEWRGQSAAGATLPDVDPSPGTQTRLLVKPGAAQAEIRVGHVAPSRTTADYFPLTVLNTMLGGSFTSRLNMRLREEMAVTYGASSKFNLRMQGGVFWAGSAVASNAAGAAVAVILKEMSRLRDEPADQAELQRAAQYLAFGLPRHFESTEDIAAHLREQLLYGLEDDYWVRFVDEVLAVTPAQVEAVADRHLQPAHAVAVVVADRAVAPDLQTHEIGALTMVEA